MGPLKGKKILIVDDETDLRETIRFELEMNGASVVEASGGHEAFKISQEQSFDLVLSDVRMPAGDGVELLQNLMAVDFRRPVVMLITGFSDLPPEQAYQMGASAFLSKPFDPERLIDIMASALQTKIRDKRLEANDPKLKAYVHHKNLDSASTAGILNLGRGGAFISATGQFPEVNDLVTFEFSFESQDPIQGFGIVRWRRTKPIDSKPTGYGIEFYAIDQTNWSRLQQLLESLKSKVPFIPAC